MSFTNGITVSVQWGPGNYCEHIMLTDWDKPEGENNWGSENAEVAIFYQGEFLEVHNDDVIGYLPADKVGRIIGIFASCKNVGENIGHSIKEVEEVVRS